MCTNGSVKYEIVLDKFNINLAGFKFLYLKIYPQ